MLYNMWIEGYLSQFQPKKKKKTKTHKDLLPTKMASDVAKSSQKC
jgi:hypothetical protein